MRKLTALLAAALLFGTFGCKTTEENYRRAYEKAKAKEMEGIDSTIYTQIRREAQPMQVAIDGDTVGMRREYVSVADGQNLRQSDLRRYSVVVAQFKQIFHARSMCKRIGEKGYPGAFIIQTREPLYYVVAATSDTLPSMVGVMRHLQSDAPMRLPQGCPWILRASNR